MKLKPRSLRVFPNPWGVRDVRDAHAATMDAEGRPCGVCPTDPIVDRGAPGRLVGAAVDAENTVVGATREGEIRSARQSTTYAFLGCPAHETEPHELAQALAKKEPVTIPFSQYYCDRIREGSLIAADEATARFAGVKFVDPKTLIPALSKIGADAVDARYEGEKAYEHFIAERKAAKTKAESEAESATPPEGNAKASEPSESDATDETSSAGADDE